MGRMWSGFMAQNEVAKLQWAAMEQSQLESVQKALRAFSTDLQRREEEEAADTVCVPEEG